MDSPFHCTFGYIFGEIMTFKFNIGNKVHAKRKESEAFYGFDFVGIVTGRKNSDDPEYSLTPSHPKTHLFWEEELTMVKL